MRVGVVRATGLAAVLGSVAILLASSARDLEAQTTELLAGAVDGGFEAGGTGWFAASSQLVLDTGGPVHGGAQAGRVEATAQGPIALRSQYGLVPTVAQVSHTLRLWLYDDDPRTSTIEVELQFLKSDGLPRNALIEPVGSSTSGWRLVTITLSGLEGAAYARIEVRATANAAGARFYVDDVTLERDPLPPPTPTPAATSTPVATPTATASPTSTATSTVVASPTPSSTATPASTPASGAGVFDVLTNGDFGDALYGWSDVGAEVEAIGGGARISSQSTSTKYLYQLVRVVPGRWYEGSARLVLGPGVDAAWMRIAWYASADGSGSQLATADSVTLTGEAGATSEVRTGPLQAPLEAQTGQVRIMLRPLSAALAQVTVDDVRFEATSAPPPPAPTPAPASTIPANGAQATIPPAPAGAGAPSPSVAEGTPAPRLVAGRPVEPDGGSAASAGGSRAGTNSGGGTRSTSSGGVGGGGVGSGGAAGPASTPPARLEGFAPEILLRITELMPDPSEPGNDADFEWVEVSDVGSEPIALAGIVLRDNAGVVALPDLVLQAGASLVLAGPRAAVPGASAFWPPGGLSNGLGNSGDRLALFTADGRIIDALSYGSDATYDNPPLLPPGPGRSLKRYFGDDGTYAGAEASDVPSPGRFEPPPARAGSPEDAPSGAAGRAIGDGGGSGRSTWYVLAGLGVVAMAGAAAQRVWALRHRDAGTSEGGASRSGA